MGIKNLNAFLDKHAKLGVSEQNISKYSGKTFAIDTSIFLYKFKYSGKFLDSFINQVYHLKRFDIDMIYVFDGAPPVEKQDIIDSRKVQKNKLKNKIEELENLLETLSVDNLLEKKNLEDLIKQNRRKCITITKEDIIELKNIFDLIGVKYIQAECEADLICCKLYKSQTVDGCISNDMDFLPSGCGILLRNYNNSNTVLEYNLENILQLLDFSMDEFIDFCILCGCDYTCKIPRLGSETAFKLIKSHNNIENILENFCGTDKKYKLPDNFEFNKARKLILGIKESEQTNIQINNLKFEKPHLMKIDEKINYISSKTKFSNAQVKNKLNKIFM